MGTQKTVAASEVVSTELVLPNDTNQLGNLLGGRLMHWIDITAAIAAYKHAGRVCVTASVDEINFHHPIKLGEIVTLHSSVNRAFRSSMEVGVIVTAYGLHGEPSRRANDAFLTFVAIDENGRPVPVDPIIPESPEERQRYDEALDRREHRLSRRRSG